MSYTTGENFGNNNEEAVSNSLYDAYTAPITASHQLKRIGLEIQKDKEEAMLEQQENTQALTTGLTTVGQGYGIYKSAMEAEAVRQKLINAAAEREALNTKLIAAGKDPLPPIEVAEQGKIAKAGEGIKSGVAKIGTHTKAAIQSSVPFVEEALKSNLGKTAGGLASLYSLYDLGTQWRDEAKFGEGAGKFITGDWKGMDQKNWGQAAKTTQGLMKTAGGAMIATGFGAPIGLGLLGIGSLWDALDRRY